MNHNQFIVWHRGNTFRAVPAPDVVLPLNLHYAMKRDHRVPRDAEGWSVVLHETWIDAIAWYRQTPHVQASIRRSSR